MIPLWSVIAIFAVWVNYADSSFKFFLCWRGKKWFFRSLTFTICLICQVMRREVVSETMNRRKLLTGIFLTFSVKALCKYSPVCHSAFKEPVTSKTFCNISVNINITGSIFEYVDSYNCLGAGYEVRLSISLSGDLEPLKSDLRRLWFFISGLDGHK